MLRFIVPPLMTFGVHFISPLTHQLLLHSQWLELLSGHTVTHTSGGLKLDKLDLQGWMDVSTRLDDRGSAYGESI